MLIVAGYLQVAAHERASYLELATAATALARDASGCLEFVQAPDPIEADRIVIYERWESEEDLLAFRNSDPEPSSTPLPDVLGADVRRFEISSIGPA
jgi:quinol monooxygenase YgiN